MLSFLFPLLAKPLTKRSGMKDISETAGKNQLLLSLESTPFALSSTPQTLTPESKVYPNAATALWGLSTEYRRLNVFSKKFDLFGIFRYAAGSKTFAVEQETDKATLKASVLILLAGVGRTFPFRSGYYVMPRAALGFHYAPLSMSHPTQTLYEQTMNRYGPVVFLGAGLGMTLPKNLVAEFQLGLTCLLYSGYMSNLFGISVSIGYGF